MKISKQKVVSVLRAIADYAAINTCLHDETHRGGVLWEICDQCGMMWADDEGGKPAGAHDSPKAIEDAYALLAEIEGHVSSKYTPSSFGQILRDALQRSQTRIAPRLDTGREEGGKYGQTKTCQDD